MDRITRNLVFTAFAIVSLAFLFSISACVVGSNDRRNANLCIDQGGIYVRTANGEYDCVGETPSMTRTR